MRISLFAGAALVMLVFTCCEKNTDPVPADTSFHITVNNEISPLDGRFGVFLSDTDGKILIYQEVPGGDTARLELPDTQSGDRFDCTVVKITTLEAPGSGIKDTSLFLTTYTGLKSGEKVNLRELNYFHVTDLFVTFTGVTSVDTIIVPDGLTFVRPQASNNFTGQYRVLHTGKIWLRVRVNGQPVWRFIVFNDVSGSTYTTTTDANLLLPIFAAPTNITLPFTAAWQYKVDGLVDTAALKFIAMGDLLRAPGGAIPVFDNVDIFEPVSNDVFNPGPKIYNGFRVRVDGSDNSPGGYTYFSDFFYTDIPTSLPEPAFDLSPTVLSDNRLVATQCTGNFDVLVFARNRAGTPNITWEVYTTPSNSIVSYRLPDVPETLGNQFPALKNYDFGGQVRARAESYQKLDYESAIRNKLLNADPIWQAKAGYLGREEVQ
ncbi:MAG TPA: hypothetical protein PK228_04915 [Saprospiraceae bacterium]|nr:hypothetical protein [Saprospiraceae bacterium]